MKLWHQSLIPYLDNQRILGQHRECCALRGNGWGKKHSTVDYIFKYSPVLLWRYHIEVMKEMKKRGYSYDESWENVNYRGKNCELYNFDLVIIDKMHIDTHLSTEIIYLEHNKDYLIECIELLKNKGTNIDFEKIKENLLKMM